MKKKKTKREQERDSLWSRKLKKTNDGCWSGLLQLISQQYNQSMAIKAACIVWWDCYKANESYDWSCPKSYIRSYKKQDEENYSDDDLIEVLISIGYPSEIAIARVNRR